MPACAETRGLRRGSVALPPSQITRHLMETTPPIVLVVMAAWATIAAVLLFALGIDRIGSIRGPLRWPSDQPIWTLWVTLFVVLVFWLALPAAYGAASRHGPAPTSQNEAHPFAPAEQSQPFTTLELIALASASYAAAFAALIAAMAFSRRPILQWLGMRRGQILTGAAHGLVGTLIAIPVVFWAGFLTVIGWELIGYEHPREHEMLNALSATSNAAVQWLIVLTAVVGAPVFEEIFFRGLLQTALKTLFVRQHVQSAPEDKQPPPVSMTAPTQPMIAPPVPEPAMDTDVGTTQSPDAQQRTASPHPDPLEYRRVVPMQSVSLLGIWTAVLISSAVFGLVHELWTVPPIFVLSICLGYAYERTGNLWVPLTMHACFNAFNVVQFLLMR
jgi:membrane protease YdiL (CAAX protease family)